MIVIFEAGISIRSKTSGIAHCETEPQPMMSNFPLNFIIKTPLSISHSRKIAGIVAYFESGSNGLSSKSQLFQSNRRRIRPVQDQSETGAPLILVRKNL